MNHFILIFSILLFSYSQGKAQAEIVEVPTYAYHELFPETGIPVGFKMSKKDFLYYVEQADIETRSNSSETMFLISPANKPYTGVVYDFSSNLGEVLTEIEIRFADENLAASYFADHYPPTGESQGDFIKFEEEHMFRVKAWQFGNKIFFVGVLENTRWSNQ